MADENIIGDLLKTEEERQRDQMLEGMPSPYKLDEPVPSPMLLPDEMTTVEPDVEPVVRNDDPTAGDLNLVQPPELDSPVNNAQRDPNKLKSLINTYREQLSARPSMRLSPGMPELQGPEDLSQRLDEINKSKESANRIAAILQGFNTISSAGALVGGKDIGTNKEGVAAIKDMMMVQPEGMAEKLQAEEKQRKEANQLAKESYALESGQLKDEYQKYKDMLSGTKESIGLEEKEMSLEKQEKLMDPNSPESKVLQDITKKLIPSISDEQLAQMSGQSLMKVIPNIQSYAAKVASSETQTRKLDQREKEEERRIRVARLNAARGLLKDDPRYKKAIEQGMEFESVDVLLDQMVKGNPTALAQLGTKMARAMGEVGVLTDADVVRYVQGRPWADQLMSWYTGGMEGKLPDAVATGLKNSLSTMKGKLKDDTKRVYENAKNRLTTAFPDMGEEEANNLLGMPDIKQEEDNSKKSEAPYGDVVERNGKQYKWNATAGKYQLYNNNKEE